MPRGLVARLFRRAYLDRGKARWRHQYTVHEVNGHRLRRSGTALVTSQRRPMATGTAIGPNCSGELRGVAAIPVIERIEAAVAAYPYDATYRVWPGPNSNTFTAFVLREAPELRVDLPPTAIGKDYLGIMPVGKLPSGTGGQISLLGLAGVAAGAEEGLEVNVLGMTFGVDPGSLALKLPFIGRLGAADQSSTAATLRYLISHWPSTFTRSSTPLPAAAMRAGSGEVARARAEYRLVVVVVARGGGAGELQVLVHREVAHGDLLALRAALCVPLADVRHHLVQRFATLGLAEGAIGGEQLRVGIGVVGIEHAVIGPHQLLDRGAVFRRTHEYAGCGAARRRGSCRRRRGVGSVAGSQCSSALPFTKRQVSNQVVVYDLVASSAYLNSRTTSTVTKSPSACTATTGLVSFVQVGVGTRLATLMKYFLHAREAGSGHGVVLDVAVRQPLAGTIPLVALEQLAHDAQRRLLVAMESLVLAGEQRFRVRVRHHRIGQRAHLRGSGQRHQDGDCGSESQSNGT